MAQLPYDGGAPTVAPETRAPDDYQHIEAKPEQFGGLIAKGAQQLGAGTEKAAENVFDISQFRGKVNTDYEGNNFIDYKDKLFFGDPSKPKVGPDGNPVMGPNGKPMPDTGYMGLQGREAADQRQAVLDQLKQRREQGRANLKSPQEQLEYDNQTRRIYAEAESHIGIHAEQQWKQWAGGVNQSGAQLSLNGFLRNLGNGQEMMHHARDFINFRMQEAHLKYGYDPQIEQEAVAGAKQELLKAHVDAVGVHDPKQAIDILEKNRNIAGTQYDDMYNRLRARKQQQGGVEAGADAITRAEGGGAPIDLSRKSTFRSVPIGEVKGFIFHHTAGTGTPEGVIDTLNQRGLGVQYIMDRDGQVYRALPNGARGAHVLPNVTMGLSNFNTEGMEIIAKHDNDVTPAQIESVKRFSAAYSEAHPGVAFYGHGEVNPGHKEADEGAAAVQAASGRTVAAAAREGTAGGGRFAAFGRVGPEDDPRGMVPYIRATAQKYGINPDAAVAVAKSEGLSGFKSGIAGENSFGAFQLNDKGMGAEFQKATGLDPSDPRNERATIDYAMRRASEIGNWGPWHGAKNRYGWTNEGIGNAGAGTLGASGAAPAYASRKADAYQIIADRTDLDHEEKVHAYQYVNQTINAQEIAENQQQRAKKQAVDHAAGSYFTEIIDAMHSPNPDYVALSGRINHDPVLADDMHTKAALIDRIKKLSGEEEALGFGPGYLAARDGLFSAPDAPGHINDMTALAQRPDITMAGLSDLSKRWTLAKRSVDHGATERQVNFFLQDAKSKLSFEQDMGPLKIRDPKGEHIFNAEFAPKFVKRVSELADEAERTGDHRKLDDFLTAESVSKMIRSFRDPRQMAAERLSATGEASGDSLAPDNPNLRPPAPEGADETVWNGLMAKPPMLSTGTAATHQQWAQALNIMLATPTPKVLATLDKYISGSGYKARDLLERLNPAAAKIMDVESQQTLGQEQRFSPTGPPPAAPGAPPSPVPPAAGSPASPAVKDETGRPRTGAEMAETARLQAEENLRAQQEKRAPRSIPYETPEQLAAREGRQHAEADETARAMKEGFGAITHAEPAVRKRMLEGERTSLESELAELDKNEREAKAAGAITTLQQRGIDRRRAALRARLDAVPRE